MDHIVVTKEKLEGAKMVLDSAQAIYDELSSRYYRQQADEHAAKSRAALPQTCNHGKLVKVDNIGPMSSGYYYHVQEDGKGGWKPAEDGTNYCDDWPGKGE